MVLNLVLNVNLRSQTQKSIVRGSKCESESMAYFTNESGSECESESVAYFTQLNVCMCVSRFLRFLQDGFIYFDEQCALRPNAVHVLI